MYFQEQYPTSLFMMWMMIWVVIMKQGHKGFPLWNSINLISYRMLDKQVRKKASGSKYFGKSLTKRSLGSAKNCWRMLNCIHSTLLRRLSWFWQGFARIYPVQIGFLFLWILRIINIKKKKNPTMSIQYFHPWITTILPYCKFCINIANSMGLFKTK